jgi:hypothetical protein
LREPFGPTALFAEDFDENHRSILAIFGGLVALNVGT